MKPIVTMVMRSGLLMELYHQMFPFSNLLTVNPPRGSFSPSTILVSVKTIVKEAALDE